MNKKILFLQKNLQYCSRLLLHIILFLKKSIFLRSWILLILRVMFSYSYCWYGCLRHTPTYNLPLGGGGANFIQLLSDHRPWSVMKKAVWFSFYVSPQFVRVSPGATSEKVVPSSQTYRLFATKQDIRAYTFNVI